MKLKRKALALALCLLMLVSLFGCGTQNTPAGSGSASSGEATSSMLNVHLQTEVSTMDAQLATDGYSFEVIGAVMEGLYRLDTDGSTVYAMAESVEKSEDGLTYTCKIRDDAKWSNGEPVTAADFVYAWQRAVDPNTASEYAFLYSTANIANATACRNGEKPVSELGIQAADEKTVVVTLDAPCAFLESLMAFATFYPLNQAFYESCGASYASSPETLLCNGPFKLSSYEPAATTIVAEKNENYYDADAVTISGVTWKVIKDAQQAMLAYENQEVDMAILRGEQVELYSDSAEYHPIMSGYLWFVSPNQHVAGLENENIRLAMAKAVDKEALVNNVLKDGSVKADYLIPKDFATGPDGKDYRDGSAEYLSYDVSAAQDYWQKGLTELGVSGITLKLDCTDDESAQNIALFLQDQWQTNLPGLTVELNPMPKTQAAQNKRAGEYEMTLTRWGPDYADPMSYLEMWVSGNSNNYGDWSNDEYDQKIAFCFETADVSARWETMKEAEAIAADAAVIYPLFQSGSAVMIRSNVSGIEFHSVGVTHVYRNVTIG